VANEQSSLSRAAPVKWRILTESLRLGRGMSRRRVAARRIGDSITTPHVLYTHTHTQTHDSITAQIQNSQPVQNSTCGY